MHGTRGRRRKPTPVRLRAGTRLGPYELRELIGVGGTGEVYRAHDGRIGRDVALKILPAAFAQRADRLQRFQQEVRSAGALNHPNIITVHDVGMSEGVPYVVAELLEGQTLRAVIAQSAPLAGRRALDYARQIAVGLAAAHAKGLVHRDLKPENLFVLDDDRVKILDFGLAKIVASEEMLSTVAGATSAGVILGTVGYMAPEHFGAIHRPTPSARFFTRSRRHSSHATVTLRQASPQSCVFVSRRTRVTDFSPRPTSRGVGADAVFQMLLQQMKGDVVLQRARAAERGLLDLSTLVSAQR